MQSMLLKRKIFKQQLNFLLFLQNRESPRLNIIYLFCTLRAWEALSVIKGPCIGRGVPSLGGSEPAMDVVEDVRDIVTEDLIDRGCI